MTQTNMLFLGGGGDAPKESQLWDLVFRPGQHVAVWPFAQPPDRQQGVMNWLTKRLSERGSFAVVRGDTPPDFGLAKADVLAIPGGNTFDLLDYMRRNDLLAALKDFVGRGGKVYGGSAGAIVLGADIAIADVKTGGLDSNDIDLADTRALDLLGGAVVYPHFEESDDGCNETCQRWANGHDVTVIGIPETCGVAVDDKQELLNAGPSDVFLFRPGRAMERYESGRRWLASEAGN